MAGSSDGGFSPLAKTLRLLSGLALLTLVVQVSVNRPEDRPEVVCYPPYLGVRFFGVTLVEIAFPREHVFLIRSSAFTNRVYRKCIDVTSHLPGFE